MMSYLKVFDVWKWNPNGDHCPGIIVCEIKTFAHFASADSNEQCPIYIGKKKTRHLIRKQEVARNILENGA